MSGVGGASGLKDKELFTKQDPYVVVEYGSQRFRTKTDKDGGTTPAFNSTFHLQLLPAAGVNFVRRSPWACGICGTPSTPKSQKQRGSLHLIIKAPGAPGGYPPSSYPPAPYPPTTIPPSPAYPAGSLTRPPSGPPNPYPPAPGHPALPHHAYPPPSSSAPPPIRLPSPSASPYPPASLLPCPYPQSAPSPYPAAHTAPPAYSKPPSVSSSVNTVLEQWEHWWEQKQAYAGLWA
ncbi:unnamed protein product [Closterium sp. NIES-64]|nr:unnamed protein product [Closterium sp. NIES-64]